MHLPRPTFAPRLPGLEPAPPRYVLIAQPEIGRAARCLEALRPLGLGALMARDANEALAIMRHFGAPVLLLAALSLPEGDGFVVMRALRSKAGPHAAVIIGLTSVNDATRLSPQARRALGISSLLPHTVRPDVLREAIDRALEQIGLAVPGAAVPSTEREHTPESIAITRYATSRMRRPRSPVCRASPCTSKPLRTIASERTSVGA
jgi:CheY-like chemotaxis protein